MLACVIVWNPHSSCPSVVFLSYSELDAVPRFCAGAMAGASAVSMTYPLDLMRAKLAVQTATNLRYVVDTRSASLSLFFVLLLALSQLNVSFFYLSVSVCKCHISVLSLTLLFLCCMSLYLPVSGLCPALSAVSCVSVCFFSPFIVPHFLLLLCLSINLELGLKEKIVCEPGAKKRQPNKQKERRGSDTH